MLTVEQKVSQQRVVTSQRSGDVAAVAAVAAVTAQDRAVPLGVVENESVGVIVDVGAAARYPASSSLVLGPTSLSLSRSLSFS